MQHRTLFVDDEPPLLRGIERRLGFDYELDTAESGHAALDLIAEKGPYSVVITDMRMPRMDGLEFLKRAQDAAPESVYVMLTGNNDQGTAQRALNEGRVFRFLNKPCESDELKRTIDDGIRQFELVRSEKERLHRTLFAAVRAATDTVDAGRPGLGGRSASIEAKVETLRLAAGIDDRWEYRFAARLSGLGVALLADDDRRDLEQGESERFVAALDQASQTSRRLLVGEPGLRLVAEICGHTDAVTGKLSPSAPKSDEATIGLGATLLRVAAYWDAFQRHGGAGSELSQRLKAAFPELPPAAFEAVALADAEDAANFHNPINDPTSDR